MTKKTFTLKQVETMFRERSNYGPKTIDTAWDRAKAELTRTPYMPKDGEVYLYKSENSHRYLQQCGLDVLSNFRKSPLSDSEIPYYKVLREALEEITNPSAICTAGFAKATLAKAAAMRGE